MSSKPKRSMLHNHEFQLKSSRQFFDYWNGLPKDGVLPDRASFNPVRIRHLMPNIVMVEYPNLDDARFRLVGTRLTEYLDFDPTNRSYMALLAEDAVESFRFVSSVLLDTPCGGRFTILARAANGYVLKVELTDLPMTNKTAGTQIILAHAPVLEVMDRHDESGFQILDIQPVAWIDIGAGTPEIAVPSE